MAHVNRFLTETHRVNRRRFKESIIAVRVGGADKEGYTKYMNHLRQADRVAQRRQQSERRQQPMRTYEEETWMAAREHVKLAELPTEQQTAFAAQRDSLWGQIPAHLQAKARKLAGR